jgi:hypothetical protein
MQKFERGSQRPPAVLASAEVQAARERMRDFMRFDDEKRAQTNVPRSDVPIDDESMHQALRRLFHGKCAFCETRTETLAYRFRPRSEALPRAAAQGHLYYAWLADAWENIHAICRTCQPREPDRFPVTGPRVRLPTSDELDQYIAEGDGLWRKYPIAEKPELLDPCAAEDFQGSFSPALDGRLSGLTKRGKATIEHFNLNDPGTVTARAGAHRQRLDELDGLCRRAPSELDEHPLFEFLPMEFGGTWYLLLRRIARQIDKGVSVSQINIAGFYTRLLKGPDASNRIKEALSALEQADIFAAATAPAPPLRPTHARLDTIEIANFKAMESLRIKMPEQLQVRDMSETPPAPSLLILGENAAGKSSILEAIALVLCDGAARGRLGLSPGHYRLMPSYMGAPATSGPRDARVSLTLSDGRSKTLRVVGGGFQEDGAGFGTESVPVFAYGAFRQYQQQQRIYTAERHIQNLFSGGLLSNPEQWLLRLNDDNYAMVIRALREILSIEGDFDVIKREPGEKRCYIVTASHQADGTATFSRTPLAAASSGFRSILSMVCDIMQGLMDRRVYAEFENFRSARGVVLIDEVEAHLHPRWKMQIMAGLRRAMPQMTFVATTHDPLCLRGMNNGEVVVLQRVEASDSTLLTNLPVVVEHLNELPDLSKLRVEQLLTSDFFQLLSTDSPEMERRMADLADLLSKEAQGIPLQPTEKAALDSFRLDIGSAMPVGNSEAHRLVQEAVAAYLSERRAASAQRMNELRDATRQQIVRILQGV